MAAIFTAVQEELATIGLSLGSDGLSHQRSILNGESSTNETTKTLLKDFRGIGIPESSGGDGGSLVDLVVFIESLARNVEPTNYVIHMAAVQVALGAGLDVSPAVAGNEIWTLGLCEKPGQRWGEWGCSISKDGVSVVKLGVPYAQNCQGVVIAGAKNEIALVDQFSVIDRASLDPSLQFCDVSISGKPREIGKQTHLALLRGALVVSAELVGVARGALQSASEYAASRQQFGQFIGSFQGIAHLLADAFVEVEAAWSLVLYSAWAVEEFEADAVVSTHSAIAKAGAAAIEVTEKCLQVFGGIGVTWEADAHLYIRRVLALNAILGGYASHYRLTGQQLLADQ